MVSEVTVNSSHFHVTDILIQLYINKKFCVAQLFYTLRQGCIVILRMSARDLALISAELRRIELAERGDMEEKEEVRSYLIISNRFKNPDGLLYKIICLT